MMPLEISNIQDTTQSALQEITTSREDKILNMSKIQLKKKSWDDISINDYYELVDAMEDAELQPLDKSVSLLAILCDCAPDDIYNLPVYEIDKMNSQIGWVRKFDFNKRFKSKHLTIAGKKYSVCVNLQEMTISQYMDFQTLWAKNDLRTYWGNILCCFIVPEGKKYCEDYDVQALADEFRNEVPITLANSVCFFFLKRLLTSIKSTLLFLTIMMKKMGKTENKELKEQMEAAKKTLYRLQAFLKGR